MSVLLADVSVTQWVLLGLILVLIILYPVFMVFKNKKEKEKFDELSTSLKVGEKVLTSSGVYGEIVSITEEKQGKLVVLKTGDEKHQGYITVDVLAIYTVFHEQQLVSEESEQEVKKQQPETVEQAEVAPEAEKADGEKPVKAKKTSQKSKKSTK